MATAITSGISAMLMEWGVLRGNDITMDTVSIQKYLIRGSNGIEEPNRLWGDYVIIVSDSVTLLGYMTGYMCFSIF